MNISKAELMLQEKLDQLEHTEVNENETPKDDIWEQIHASIQTQERNHHRRNVRLACCLIALALILPSGVFAASKLSLFDGLITSDKYHLTEKYGSTNSATGIVGDYRVRIERSITSKDNSEGTLSVSFAPTSEKILPIHKLLDSGRAGDGTLQDLRIYSIYKDSQGKVHKNEVPSMSYSYNPEMAESDKEYLTIRYSFLDGSKQDRLREGSRVYLTLTNTITTKIQSDNDGDSVPDETYTNEKIKEHKRLYLPLGTGYAAYEIREASYKLEISPISLTFTGALTESAEHPKNFIIKMKDGSSTTLEDLGVCGSSVSYTDGQPEKTKHSYEFGDIIDVDEIDTIQLSDVTFHFNKKKSITNR